MNKRKTSAITVIFYVIGILFLVIGAFMLISAISYTKTYLQTYDAKFSDMWSNSIQYVIAQCAPYLGVGVICLGIGKVVSAIRNVQFGAGLQSGGTEVQSGGTEVQAGENTSGSIEEAQAKQLAAADKIAERIRELAAEVEANREVLGIKIEEKEKRDSVRIKELEGDILYTLRNAGVGPSEEPSEAAENVESGFAEAEQTDFADAQTTETPQEDTNAALAASPQIFTIARTMVMPACPKSIPCQKEEKAETLQPETQAAPQIFTIARTMVMPACPAHLENR